MTVNAVVRARIDKGIKEKESAVLASIGLTKSDTFRLMFTRIAKEKALPLDPLVPNTKTIEAIKASRRGDLITVDTVDHLLTSLNEDD